ncbi:hypothetical protein WJX73_002382 [Symbiochloris irregularis]|uniref:Protein kinase domain-containing protein n=1 Tax=Symbiochloris irregularis TaxID=706552 RepID=A0AAW1P7P1_9CHLO
MEGVAGSGRGSGTPPLPETKRAWAPYGNASPQKNDNAHPSCVPVVPSGRASALVSSSLALLSRRTPPPAASYGAGTMRAQAPHGQLDSLLGDKSSRAMMGPDGDTSMPPHIPSSASVRHAAWGSAAPGARIMSADAPYGQLGPSEVNILPPSDDRGSRPKGGIGLHSTRNRNRSSSSSKSNSSSVIVASSKGPACLVGTMEEEASQSHIQTAVGGSCAHCQVSAVSGVHHMPLLGLQATLTDLQAPQEGWCRHDFEYVKELGRTLTRHGEPKVLVTLQREKRTGHLIALKAVDVSLLNWRDQDQLEREVAIHQQLRHPHILRLYGHFFEEGKQYMVLEYAQQGDLFGQLYDQDDNGDELLRPCDEVTAARYIGSLAQALQYCLAESVWHRDIKAENVLVMEDGTLKLADFGATRRSRARRQTYAGTAQYMAPEMRNADSETRLTAETYTESVDWWSMGVLLYELLVAHVPFAILKTDNALNNINDFLADPDAVLLYPDSPRVSDAAKRLVSKLLRADPEQRISPAAVLSDPWIQQGFLDGHDRSSAAGAPAVKSVAIATTPAATSSSSAEPHVGPTGVSSALVAGTASWSHSNSIVPGHGCPSSS